MEIISENCLQLLPFSQQSLSSWTDRVDILEYLYRLYDQPCIFIDHTGTTRQSNYRDYGRYLFDKGMHDFIKIAIVFKENAEKK